LTVWSIKRNCVKKGINLLRGKNPGKALFPDGTFKGVGRIVSADRLDNQKPEKRAKRGDILGYCLPGCPRIRFADKETDAVIGDYRLKADSFRFAAVQELPHGECIRAGCQSGACLTGNQEGKKRLDQP